MNELIEQCIKDKFKAINLFSKCATSGEFDFPVNKLFDWVEAEESFLSEEWEDFTEEAGNELRSYLHGNNIEQYRKWNDYAREANDFIDTFLMSKIVNYQQVNNIDPIFIDCVKSDLAFSMLYQQYSIVIKEELPQFYDRILAIYNAGYFPCGWDPKSLDGILVVI